MTVGHFGAIWTTSNAKRMAEAPWICIFIRATRPEEGDHLETTESGWITNNHWWCSGNNMSWSWNSSRKTTLLLPVFVSLSESASAVSKSIGSQDIHINKPFLYLMPFLKLLTISFNVPSVSVPWEVTVAQEAEWKSYTRRSVVWILLWVIHAVIVSLGKVQMSPWLCCTEWKVVARFGALRLSQLQ